MTNQPYEQIVHQNELIAIVLRTDYKAGGISFLTPRNLSQQLGYLPHKKGNIIKAHFHNQVHRDVILTLEAIFIKKGKIAVNLYTKEKKYIKSVELNPGDLILLCSGGHGFNILEDAELIEIKQGPYMDADKERFEGIENDSGKRTTD